MVTSRLRFSGSTLTVDLTRVSGCGHSTGDPFSHRSKVIRRQSTGHSPARVLRNRYAKMPRWFSTIALAMCLSLVSRVEALELLTAGDFEVTGLPEVPGWTLEEFATGSADSINTALYRPRIGGSPGLVLLPSAGGEAVGPNNLTNAILSQMVPAVPGEVYRLTGKSAFEENYSGFVNTLDGGPLDGQASPTTTTFEIAFLDSGGNVLGTPVALDLRTEQTIPGFLVESTLMGTAPANTFSARVTAAARDMVWNGAPDGMAQSAFFDEFSLTAASAPAAEILTNPLLDELPAAIDYWDVTSDPPSQGDALQTSSFANHTPGGSQGIWLKSCLEFAPFFASTPVDGLLSKPSMRCLARPTHFPVGRNSNQTTPAVWIRLMRRVEDSSPVRPRQPRR